MKTKFNVKDRIWYLGDFNNPRHITVKEIRITENDIFYIGVDINAEDVELSEQYAFKSSVALIEDMICEKRHEIEYWEDLLKVEKDR